VPSQVGVPAHVRRSALLNGYCFHCQCPRCTEGEGGETDRALAGLRCPAALCGQLARSGDEACAACATDLSPLQVSAGETLH
jgi:hypothetical protein